MEAQQCLPSPARVMNFVKTTRCLYDYPCECGEYCGIPGGKFLELCETGDTALGVIFSPFFLVYAFLESLFPPDMDHKVIIHIPVLRDSLLVARVPDFVSLRHFMANPSLARFACGQFHPCITKFPGSRGCLQGGGTLGWRFLFARQIQNEIGSHPDLLAYHWSRTQFNIHPVLVYETMSYTAPAGGPCSRTNQCRYRKGFKQLEAYLP